MDQISLFAAEPVAATADGPFPEGLVYEPDWLSRADEAALLAFVGRLPFEAARYKTYTARRRTVGFGGRFDYDTNRLLPAPPLDPALLPLRDRVARWAGLDPSSLVHALVSEYAPGTPLGWHRDVPDFEDVVGLSLGGPAMLRFRPHLARGVPRPARDDVVRLAVAPRSIYRMSGAARWRWQHSVVPVDAMRWSITFRTTAVERRSRVDASTRVDRFATTR